MSQKYVIVHFADNTSVPSNFPMSQWPLHVTLLANFQTDRLDEVRHELRQIAHSTKPFSITADGEAAFGPQQSVAVSLIRPDVNILQLHATLLRAVTGLGGVFDEPQYNATGYRPHATIQRSGRLQDQQSLLLDTFTLVDMYPDQDIKRRQIVETYHLHS